MFESDTESSEDIGVNLYAIPAKRVELVAPLDSRHSVFTVDFSDKFIREVYFYVHVNSYVLCLICM